MPLSPLVVEACVMRGAIMLAYNLDWGRVVFESDNLLLVEACRREKIIIGIQMIVVNIFTIADGFTHIGFTWTQQTGNAVALHVAPARSKDALPVNSGDGKGSEGRGEGVGDGDGKGSGERGGVVGDGKRSGRGFEGGGEGKEKGGRGVGRGVDAAGGG
ncbi:Reverse transcriptase-like [Sesbania bispinosa]|nr:Reverse transcriptase-like [Sesbania bispinosa]